MEAHALPRHPLLAFGYLSVGCMPCTEPVQDAGAGARSGRWAGLDKTECGIHLGADGKFHRVEEPAPENAEANRQVAKPAE
jgi:phosphoadenosine phosphosulfate reductase